MGRPKITTAETLALERVVGDKPQPSERGAWLPTYYSAVRDCLDAGITPYKIGVLTGNTSAPARRKLIEKARQHA